jgi:hypothetical protein
MREYLVSPALILMRPMSDKARGKLPETQMASLTDVRLERVLDSAVAGVLAGGTLSGFLRKSIFILELPVYARLIEQAGQRRYLAQD